ncbi:OmpW family protein [Aquabacterium sp.]|uniref:OmpW/AlkL family protein n=1 Tax=Aquabacterium sp. TaxID=1872578 RepID=UPI0035B429DB
MKTSALTLSIAATLVAGSACAQSALAGYTVKLGGGYIDPRATSSDLDNTLQGLPLSHLPGNHLEVQKKAAVIFSIERALSENISVEFVAGVPPKHDVKLRASASAKAAYATCGTACPGATAVVARVGGNDGQVVSTVKQIAPTVFLNYKFLGASNALRPYVGVGLNYTKFDATSTKQGEVVVGTSPVKIKLSDSFGLAFQVGVNYKFNDKWSANVGWATAAVKNDMDITAANGTHVEAFYRFHPSMFNATVGYSF